MVIVNNRDKVTWHEGMNVRDVLAKMHYSFSMITVTVNGTLVPPEDYEEFQVPDDAQFGAFHLAHGG